MAYRDVRDYQKKKIKDAGNIDQSNIGHDVMDNEKKIVDNAKMDNKEKRLCLNILRRAHLYSTLVEFNKFQDTEHLVDTYQAEIDLVLQSFPSISSRLAELLYPIEREGSGTYIVKKDGNIVETASFIGTYNIRSWLDFHKFVYDDERINRYNKEFVPPPENQNLTLCKQYAMEPGEVAQDLFEEILKNNDVSIYSWEPIFYEVENLCYRVLVANIGPPSGRFP